MSGIREVERLAKMEKSAGKIRGEADTISEEVRKGTKELIRVVDKAKATLRASSIEVREDAEEAASRSS